MKVTVIPIVVRVLYAVLKIPVKSLVKLEISERLEVVQALKNREDAWKNSGETKESYHWKLAKSKLKIIG